MFEQKSVCSRCLASCHWAASVSQWAESESCWARALLKRMWGSPFPGNWARSKNHRAGTHPMIHVGLTLASVCQWATSISQWARSESQWARTSLWYLLESYFPGQWAKSESHWARTLQQAKFDFAGPGQWASLKGRAAGMPIGDCCWFVQMTFDGTFGFEGEGPDGAAISSMWGHIYKSFGAKKLFT